MRWNSWKKLGVATAVEKIAETVGNTRFAIDWGSGGRRFSKLFRLSDLLLKGCSKEGN